MHNIKSPCTKLANFDIDTLTDCKGRLYFPRFKNTGCLHVFLHGIILTRLHGRFCQLTVFLHRTWKKTNELCMTQSWWWFPIVPCYIPWQTEQRLCYLFLHRIILTRLHGWSWTMPCSTSCIFFSSCMMSIHCISLENHNTVATSYANVSLYTCQQTV